MHLQMAVHILFTGLTLFDNTKYHPNAGQYAVTALLMQRPRTAASDFYEGAVIPRHVPFMLIDAKAVASPGVFDAQVNLKDDMGIVRQTLYLYLLNDVKASVTDYNGASPDHLSLGTEVCQSSNNKVCMPRLFELCRKCGRDPNKDLDLDSPSVGGRFVLEYGKLVIPDGEDQRAVWCIRDEVKQTQCHKVLPQLVALTLENVDQITILLRNSVSGVDQSLVVKPAILGQLLVGSAPVDDLMNLHDTHEYADHHFEVYYDVFTGKIPKRVPIPRLLRSEAMMGVNALGLLFVHSSNCPPALIK